MNMLEPCIRKLGVLLGLLCVILSPLLYAAPAQAGWRTYVSRSGTYNNYCDITSPCLSFDVALSHTEDGGQITCLDQGSFGGNGNQVTITQSVTIDCNGVDAWTTGDQSTLTETDLLVINAPGKVVHLRNLDISGVLPEIGLNGIVIQAAAAVNIENCTIKNFAQNGISDRRSSGGQLTISNTVLSNNGASGSGGIDIVPSSGATIQVVINHSEIKGNNFGIGADGRQGGIIRATVRDSVISGNIANGVSAISSGASVAFLLDQTDVTGNAVGLYASGSGAGMAARNTGVFNNTIGLEAVNGGKLLTAGNNNVIGNPTEGAFTGSAGQQ